MTPEELEEVKVEELKDVFDKPMYKVTSPKFKQPFEVYKKDLGFPFYCIRVAKGQENPKLEGVWTRAKDAIEHVKNHIRSSKPSVSAMRDMKYEKNHPKE